MYEPVLIGEFTKGLQTNRRPFMINKEAWAVCENMWNFRGRMRKKYGYSLKGRLRRCFEAESLGNAPGAGTTYTANIKTLLSLESNAQIQPTTVEITVGGLITVTDDGDGTFTQTGGTATLDAANSSINYNTMIFTIELSAGTFGAEAVTVDMCYFPNLPVMGLRTRERQNVNDEQTIAFDTVYAYRFTSGQWEELPSSTPTVWTGSDSQFFWTTNFEQPGTTKLFWAVNYDGTNFTDPIRYYDNSTWNTLRPALNGAGDRFLETAKIIEPYKERLLVFYTVEEDPVAGDIVYPQRIRWSEIGDVTDTTDGWRDDIEGRGGFLDIPTAESIITVGFIRDRIIIYCDRSTWELLYTGNELDPFKLRRINTELGAESTFSRILFDNSVLAIGNVGVHTCNGDSVMRIDEDIPSFVFDFHNHNQGLARVYGVRDYYNEIVMWSYVDSRSDPTFPNRMLIYNYRDNNWSIWNDSFTCYGYFQRVDDRTWASYTSTTWGQADFTWQSGQSQARFREVVAGNQQGYVFTFFPEVSTVVPSRFITNMVQTGGNVTVTSPNHNLEVGDYVKISNVIGDDNQVVDSFIARVGTAAANTFTMNVGTDVVFPAGVTYLMNGEITKFDNIDMRTKFFTPFWKTGSSMQLNHIDFDFQRTRNGELTYDIYIDDNDAISMSDPSINIGVLGTNSVNTRPDDNEPLGFAKESTWHRAYCFTNGQTIQVRLSMNDEQMKDETINQAPITLYAFIAYVQRVDDLV